MPFHASRRVPARRVPSSPSVVPVPVPSVPPAQMPLPWGPGAALPLRPVQRQRQHVRGARGERAPARGLGLQIRPRRPRNPLRIPRHRREKNERQTLWYPPRPAPAPERAPKATSGRPPSPPPMPPSLPPPPPPPSKACFPLTSSQQPPCPPRRSLARLHCSPGTAARPRLRRGPRRKHIDRRRLRRAPPAPRPCRGGPRAHCHRRARRAPPSGASHGRRRKRRRRRRRWSSWSPPGAKCCCASIPSSTTSEPGHSASHRW
mmetsp:Transcript_122183/g.390807  ORF Transcript_122183/g.390807 Transcript_122183/m.390807 type:complete len:261 (+) Transcript_122183:759-1541(+)